MHHSTPSTCFVKGITKMRCRRFFEPASLNLINDRPSLTVCLSLTMLVLAGFLPARLHGVAPGVQAQQAITPLVTTFTVNSTSDPGGAFVSCTAPGGECTLRAAINAANSTAGDDIINFEFSPLDFGCSAGRCTINLTSPLPDLSTNINIIGPGADQLTVRRNTGGNYRIFNVTAGTVTFSGLTIRDGLLTSSGGGGISNVQGIVFINNCVVVSNSAT